MGLVTGDAGVGTVPQDDPRLLEDILVKIRKRIELEIVGVGRDRVTVGAEDIDVGP